MYSVVEWFFFNFHSTMEQTDGKKATKKTCTVILYCVRVWGGGCDCLERLASAGQWLSDLLISSLILRLYVCLAERLDNFCCYYSVALLIMPVKAHGRKIWALSEYIIFVMLIMLGQYPSRKPYAWSMEKKYVPEITYQDSWWWILYHECFRWTIICHPDNGTLRNCCHYLNKWECYLTIIYI